MPPESEDYHAEILRLIRENQSLLKENNLLLHKLYRHNLIGFVARLLWYALLIGLPFIMYVYIIQPYFEVFGSNYEVFREGMAQIPGLKGLEQFLPKVR